MLIKKIKVNIFDLSFKFNDNGTIVLESNDQILYYNWDDSCLDLYNENIIIENNIPSSWENTFKNNLCNILKKSR